MKPPSAGTQLGGTLSHFLPINTIRRTPGDKKKQAAPFEDDTISLVSADALLPASASMSSIEATEENNKSISDTQSLAATPVATPPPIPPKLPHTSSLGAIDLASPTLSFTPPRIPPRSNSPKLESLPESYLTYRKPPHRLPPEIPDNDIIPPRPPHGFPRDNDVAPPAIPPHGEVLARHSTSMILPRDNNSSHHNHDVSHRLSVDNFSSQPPPRPPRLSTPLVLTPPTPNNDKVLPPSVPRRSYSPPSLPPTRSNRSESPPPPRPPPPVKSATPPNDKDNSKNVVFKYDKDDETPPILPPRLSPKIATTSTDKPGLPPPIPPKSNR